MRRKNLVLHTIIILFFGLVLGYFYSLGPIFTLDTINYLQMASNVKKGFFPHSVFLSPGYPALLGFTSRLFSISLPSSLYFWTSFILFLSFFVLHEIVKLIINKNNFASLNSYFLSFLIISNWVVLKILVTAHADALFLLFSLIFFYCYYLWLTNREFKWFFMSVIVGCLSMWIKLNGLVFIPFLIISYLVYNHRKLNYVYLFVPLAGMLTSFLLFKSINGTTVISQEKTTILDKVIYSIGNYKLIFENFNSSGNVFFSAFFSKSITLLLPIYIGFAFMGILSFLFLRYFLFSKNIKNEENSFLLFGFIYWLLLCALEQYIGFEEISARTLFPSILSLLLWVLCKIKIFANSFKLPIIGLLVFNLMYSFYFVNSLYKTDSNNCFKSVTFFDKRKSVSQLKKIQETYNLNDWVIYTNQYRLLYYAMDFIHIKEIPTLKKFERGRFRKLNGIEYNKIYSQYCQEFSQKNSAVLLINNPVLKKMDSCLVTKNTKVFHFENDILLINLINPKKLPKS